MASSAGTVFAIIASFMVLDFTRALTLNVTYKKTPIFLDFGARFNFEVEIRDFNDNDLDLTIEKEFDLYLPYLHLKWSSPASNMSHPAELLRNPRWDIRNVQNDTSVKKFDIEVKNLTAFDDGNYSLVVQQANANKNGMESESDYINIPIAGILIIPSVHCCSKQI